jgi:hypothetical protein
MKISYAALVEKLMAMKQPTKAELVVAIEPEMVKKHRETKEPNPFLGRVKKQSVVAGIIGGWNYAQAVQNQRVREASDEAIALQQVEQFVSAPRAWGKRLENTALVEHKGQYYLELNVKEAKQSIYMVDDRIATAEELAALKNYLPKQYEEGARQEVEAPVILRDYKLASVRVLDVAGQQLEVEKVS